MVQHDRQRPLTLALSPQAGRGDKSLVPSPPESRGERVRVRGARRNLGPTDCYPVIAAVPFSEMRNHKLSNSDSTWTGTRTNEFSASLLP